MKLKWKNVSTVVSVNQTRLIQYDKWTLDIFELNSFIQNRMTNDAMRNTLCFILLKRKKNGIWSYPPVLNIDLEKVDGVMIRKWSRRGKSCATNKMLCFAVTNYWQLLQQFIFFSISRTTTTTTTEDKKEKSNSNRST